MKTAGLLVLLTLAAPATAQNIELALPIACKIGADCWVQQYADHDPTAAALDYSCGHETYDGHDGTDFRVLNTQSKADVVASAAGTIKALRDGVDDQLINSDSDRERVKSRECGNGVVIDHAGGWQTQYCHLRKGSIAVKVGESVASGTKLGEVGYSGMAGFPHVHLTVRHNGEERDPFGGKPDGAEPCGKATETLWNKAAAESLAYHYGDIIKADFHSGPVELSDLEAGTFQPENPKSSWPAMVAYAWAINLSAGDRITVTLHGPNGIEASNTATLDRNKAQYMLFAGKKQPENGWPIGAYNGSATIYHGDKLLLKRDWQQVMN
jgi:Peptidase family M23